MEVIRNKQASLAFLIASLLAQNLIICVLTSASVEDQKNYYSPHHPHHGSPPRGSHHTPSPGSGGGSYGGSPPADCGTPPSGGDQYSPSPSPPSGDDGLNYPPPSSGGSISTPSSPSDPTIFTPPAVLTPPSFPIIDPGSGGTPTVPDVSVPFPPFTASTPPIALLPPTTPLIDPGTGSSPAFPGISVPSPPFALGPNSLPFTYVYWSTHPSLVSTMLDYLNRFRGAIGAIGFPGFGSNMSLQQALLNTRTDGLGALYREGAASLLNSMAGAEKFPYTTSQVRERFVAALGSNEAAAAQARLFKLANEGHFPRT